MSDKDINKMNYKELRDEVQCLRDELALFMRKFNDMIYNLDNDNFSSRIIKEKDNMLAEIKVTAEEISTKVSKTDLDDKLEEYSTISQTAENITLAVNEIKSDYSDLSARIEIEKDRISAIVEGDYTDELLSGYFTGIEITPNSIKMVDGNTYSVYNNGGLRFYDSANQREGWAIEPDSNFGGVLNHYINGTECYTFGTGMVGSGYDSTDMCIKAFNGRRGRFVVDVSGSTYHEVKFVGLNQQSSDTPYIYANEKLLATQDWVRNNGGTGGTAVAVFG